MCFFVLHVHITVMMKHYFMVNTRMYYTKKTKNKGRIKSSSKVLLQVAVIDGKW